MTDEDRELLKLAAKAAGLDLHPSAFFYNALTLKHGDGLMAWNSLARDGDAMRLSTKLGLVISHCPRRTPPDVMVGYSTGPDHGSNWIEDYGPDADAATRRAITCAAAEVGKAMP